MKKDSLKTEKERAALFVHSQQYSALRVFRIFGFKNITKASLQNFFKTCVIPLLIGAALYQPTEFFKAYPQKTVLYLFYLIIITLTTSFAGLIAGFFTLGVIVVEILYFFEPLSNDFFAQLGLFIVSGAVIILSMYQAKQAKEIRKLKALERRYAETFVELHQAFLSSRQEIKARDEFLSIVSHELKTPLTIMLLKLSQMLNNIRNTSLAKFSVQELMKVLTNAEDQVRRMTKMINDLVNVSLITTGRMDLQLEDCNLSKVTKTVLQSFSELLKREKCKVKLEVETAVTGKWDKVRVEQAITNLVSNAIKYGQGKPIRIKVSNSGNSAKFLIQDQGIGIAEKNQESLFKLFQRAKEATGYKEGLGVGLYVTAQIVKAHGGTIKVTSKPNNGATFTIELPLAYKKSNQ